MDNKYGVMQQLRAVRCEENIEILNDSNAYRALVREKGGDLTAYYFSCPIFRQNSRELINLEFLQKDSDFVSYGFDTASTVKQRPLGEIATLKNDLSYVKISDNKMIDGVTGQMTVRESGSSNRNAISFLNADGHNSKVDVFSTFNGLAFEVTTTNHGGLSYTLYFDERIYLNSNMRVANINKQKYMPVLTVCPQFVKTVDNKTYPLQLQAISIGETAVKINIPEPQELLESNIEKTYVISMDMYMPKAILDAAVEKKNPTLNNSYSAVGYIGYGNSYGEGWIYSRSELKVLDDLTNFEVKSSRLLIPILNNSKENAKAFGLKMPWCTTETKWNQKVPLGTNQIFCKNNNNFLEADVSSIMIKQFDNFTKASNGIVIVPSEADTDMIVAMADNFYTPQILEIKLKAE